MPIVWSRGPDFAEVAEALGVRTDQIMSMMDVRSDGQEYVVFYTPEDNTLIYKANLTRDADDVLVVVGEPTPKPGMWEEITNEMDKRMDEGDE